MFDFVAGRKRKVSTTWAQLLKEQEDAAWAYATRDRTGEPGRIFVDFSTIHIIHGDPNEPAPYEPGKQKEYLQSLGMVFAGDHCPPLKLKDFKHARKVNSNYVLVCIF